MSGMTGMDDTKIMKGAGMMKEVFSHNFIVLRDAGVVKDCTICHGGSGLRGSGACRRW